MNIRVLAGMLCLAGAVATGCGAASAEPAAGRPAANAQDFGDADVRFSQEMIPHHEQTIELARLAEGRTTDPFILELSAELIRKETEDIALMEGWLREWGAPLPRENPAHQGHNMPGMLTPGEMAAVKKASGPAFNRLWLRSLAKHLDHGIDMAEDVLATGRHGPTTLLAGQIVTNQRQKIEEIRRHLEQ